MEEEETPVIPTTIPEGTDLQVMGMKIGEPGKIKTESHNDTDPPQMVRTDLGIDTIDHLGINSEHTYEQYPLHNHIFLSLIVSKVRED